MFLYFPLVSDTVCDNKAIVVGFEKHFFLGDK